MQSQDQETPFKDKPANLNLNDFISTFLQHAAATTTSLVSWIFPKFEPAMLTIMAANVSISLRFFLVFFFAGMKPLICFTEIKFLGKSVVID